MHLRLAKACDAAALARVYFSSATRIERHFLPKLGLRFLRKYHQVLLSEPNAVVLCLEDDAGEIVAFASGSLRAEEHMAALRNQSIRLVWAALFRLARDPGLLRGVRDRSQSGGAHQNHNGYIATSGPRLEFWGAVADRGEPAEVIALLKAWLGVAGQCGAERVHLEVDDDNVQARRIYQALGAHIVQSFQTEDGRARTLMCYDLAEIT